MIKIKTIKGWANSSDFLFSQNSKNNTFKANLEQFKKDNDLIEIKTGFYSQENKNKKRYIIKAWHWRGQWSDPTKEIYCYLIER